jgi:NADPH2:quinone reductase
MVRQWAPPEEMALEDIDEGAPPSDKVRVRIEATGVNFFEGLLVEGKYQVRPELPFIPGVEAAGLVVDGPPHSRFRTGDRVACFAEFGRGTYAELVDVAPTAAVPLPENMPAVDGACFLTTYLTAHLGLHRRGRLRAGETLLVHAGAGGVGSAAIQLGKAAGARVIATAGSEEKVALCLALGADAALNYREHDFIGAVKELTGGRGADVILDPVGGDVFERSTRCAAFEGRIVLVGFTSGRIAQAATNHALVKSYSIVGLHLSLHLERTPELVAGTVAELLELYRTGAIRPHVSATYPLGEAPHALRAVMSGLTTGKVALIPN